MISRNLAKTFHDREVIEYPFLHEKDPRKNKQIPLTLGKREVEYNRGNCGIFLYWHGRLIEVNSLYAVSLVLIFPSDDIVVTFGVHCSKPLG